MTGEGETFVAGILAGLPALAAVGALSAASYQRFQPSHRVGAPACPGHENREAAPRFITGMTGSGPEAANVEIKCFDQAANPYLAIGSVIAAGLAGIDRRLRLPPEVTGDPATHYGGDRPDQPAGRLPETLDRRPRRRGRNLPRPRPRRRRRPPMALLGPGNSPRHSSRPGPPTPASPSGPAARSGASGGRRAAVG